MATLLLFAKITQERGSYLAFCNRSGSARKGRNPANSGTPVIKTNSLWCGAKTLAKRASPRTRRVLAEQAARGGHASSCRIARVTPTLVPLSCSLVPAVHTDDAVGLDLERWSPVADAAVFRFNYLLKGIDRPKRKARGGGPENGGKRVGFVRGGGGGAVIPLMLPKKWFRRLESTLLLLTRKSSPACGCYQHQHRCDAVDYLV